MSVRNNNQNPNNYDYNAFMKISTQEGDLYYHFYLVRNENKITESFVEGTGV